MREWSQCQNVEWDEASSGSSQSTADIELHAVCVELSKWFPTIHATLETLMCLYRCTGFPMDSGCVCVYGMCMPCVWIVKTLGCGSGGCCSVTVSSAVSGLNIISACCQRQEKSYVNGCSLSSLCTTILIVELGMLKDNVLAIYCGGIWVSVIPVYSVKTKAEGRTVSRAASYFVGHGRHFPIKLMEGLYPSGVWKITTIWSHKVNHAAITRIGLPSLSLPGRRHIQLCPDCISHWGLCVGHTAGEGCMQ